MIISILSLYFLYQNLDFEQVISLFWISCFITQANILIRFISATEEMQVFLKTIYLKKICFQFEACDVILWHLNPYNFCGIKDNYGR